MLLKVKKLSKSFGSKVLFESAELSINESDRVALVGQNGTGKTTLIKCIVGQEDFEGVIDVAKNVKISVMEQERTFEQADKTFLEYLEAKQMVAEEKIRACEAKLGLPETYGNTAVFEKVSQEYGLLCAQPIEKIEESKIKQMLHELKFEMEDYHKKIIYLSGGQRTKLRLAECLCRNADLYLLDEPTNHLDFDTLSWLENKLLGMKKTILIVSHDRYFLSKVAGKVIELENKTFQTYNKNYVGFLQEREKHLRELTHRYDVVQKEKNRLLDSAKQKREWARLAGGNSARKFKIVADRLEKRADLLPKLPNPDEFIQKYDLNFDAGDKSGNVVFSANDISKAYNTTLFKNASFRIFRGDKVAVVGPNGSGKTTLLKMLCKLIVPDAGKVMQGFNLKIAYFDQELADLDTSQRVSEFFMNSFAGLQKDNAIATAVKFGFPKERFRVRLKNLSGGEKARLNLIRLMSNKCNVLLLDEPTNNLDMELIAVLEETLEDYEGTLVFISHDRYFINKIARKLLIIDEQEIKECNGNYSDVFG